MVESLGRTAILVMGPRVLETFEQGEVYEASFKTKEHEMADDRVAAAVASVPAEARAELNATLEGIVVGRLLDGTFVKLLIRILGRALQDLTEAQIAEFLVSVGVPQPWAGVLAKMIYGILHQDSAATAN